MSVLDIADHSNRFYRFLFFVYHSTISLRRLEGKRHIALKAILHSWTLCKPTVETYYVREVLTFFRIMFMREFPVIDAATSVDQLRMRLKDNELEQYGEAFIPEFVYEVIRRLPRFSSMRVSFIYRSVSPK